MIKCPSCGFNNPDKRERCLRCSAALRNIDLPDASERVKRSIPSLGIAAAINRFFYFLSVKLQGSLPEGVPYRYPWTAAFLALVLGSGQWYNYQKKKAFGFGLAQIGLIAWFIATIVEPYNDWIALLTIFWHFYMMADACIVAYRINGEHATFRHVLAVWFALGFFLGSFLVLAQFFGFGIFYFVTIRTDNLGPKFTKGDKIFVATWPLFFGGKPDPGAVVWYDTNSYALIRGGELSSNTYTVRERGTFGVVTALENEIMSVSAEGEVFVDHVAVPPRLLPTNPVGTIFVDDLKIPKDHVGILATHPVAEDGLLSGLGGSFGGSVPNPRQAYNSGFLIERYNEAIVIPMDQVHGIALFRYYPAERREWFGWNQGLWDDYPVGYIERKPE